MNSAYSEAFVEQALIKVYSRGGRSIRAVAQEMNVNYDTIRHWIKYRSMNKSDTREKEKRPQDWTREEQLIALHETHGLSGEPLQAWCRERGLFAHHLVSWKAAICAEGRDSAPGTQELRKLKEENAALKRDAARKDKALAEAAALLVLQKKFRALWEDEDK